MHLAKGLEFRAVAVMACDDEVIPLQERIETADDADLEEVYNTERHLLYVACTRARDHLLVTGTEPVSESWMICKSEFGTPTLTNLSTNATCQLEKTENIRVRGPAFGESKCAAKG